MFYSCVWYVEEKNILCYYHFHEICFDSSSPYLHCLCIYMCVTHHWKITSCIEMYVATWHLFLCIPLVVPSTTISLRTRHRAYGPKTLHAPRTLYFLPPDMYMQMKREMRSSIGPDSRAEPGSQVAKEYHTRVKGHEDTPSSRKLFPRTSNPMRQCHTLADSLSSSQASSFLGKKRAVTVAIDGPSAALPMKIISPYHKRQTVVTT